VLPADVRRDAGGGTAESDERGNYQRGGPEVEWVQKIVRLADCRKSNDKLAESDALSVALRRLALNSRQTLASKFEKAIGRARMYSGRNFGTAKVGSGARR
jgi:hypothetical protein